jgi:hypothetical protein
MLGRKLISLLAALLLGCLLLLSVESPNRSYLPLALLSNPT